MGILVLGISAGSSDETLNDSVTSTAMDPIATVTVMETPALVPTDGTRTDANATPTDNSTANYTFVDTNATDVSSYVDLNVTSSQRVMQAAAAARVPAVSVNFAGGAQTILLVSSLDTQTAGYTNSEPQNPLEVTGYSYRTWSPSEGTTWSGSSPWYNAASEPFGSGARWISTKAVTENNADSWRLYKTDFTVPEGSTVTSADLWYTADNAVAVYLNDEEISSAGTVYGTSSDTTPVYQNSYKVSFRPKPGPNTLKFVVRNWGAPFYNPTGLLYKGVIVQGPDVKTFSMTNTAFRTDKDAKKGELMAPAIANCNYLESELKSRGWEDPVFKNEGSAVTKADFNINPDAGHTTINSAVLHFHTGHGSPPNGINGRPNLQLLDKNNDAYSFDASEVTGKWGGNNKWVILDSCYLMLDDDWGKALDTSHGVLGFKTQAAAPSRFTKRFVEYADTDTVYMAYRKATFDVIRDTKVPKNPEDREFTEIQVAAVYFKDRYQAMYDYLPGVKTGVYTGNLSGERYLDEWPCDEPPQGVKL